MGCQKGRWEKEDERNGRKGKEKMRNVTNATWAKDFKERGRVLKDILGRFLCDVKILSVVFLGHHQ